MKNRLYKYVVVLVILVLALGAMSLTEATVGSTTDPLITLSYLEMRLSEFSTQENVETGSALFEILNVHEGDVITLGASSEIILRAGIAKAFVSEKGGLADITVGKDIGMNENIPKNHLLICPLGDGRGLVFQSEAWIMVKGSYTLYEKK